MTEEDEIEIIRRVLDGDTNSFARLIRIYQEPLIRMLATLLHDKRRFAEDIAQDVLVEAFHRLRDFDPARSQFSTWLFMIARSRGINAMKRKQPSLFAEPPETIIGSASMEERNDLSVLEQSLHELPPKQKRAFTLAVLEGLPHDEVARIESTTIGTIKSRVSRARKFLKTALETANR